VPEWSAELVVDEALARRLIAQFPELRVKSLRRLSEGWDRTVWLADERWVFGFPRRAVVVPGIEREIAFLPGLASLLPLPIPRPVFVGSAAEGFPWLFFGSELLPGHELCDSKLDEPGRTAVSLELARFLRRLHSAEVAAAIVFEQLPLDSNRRADMSRRVPMARESLLDVERRGLWRVPSLVARILDDAERLPPSWSSLTVAHGDLHVRHVLVDRGHASGVIDWIDLSRADPAIDLHLYWSLVPPAARPEYLAECGAVSEDQLLRARVLALFLCAALARYANDLGLRRLERQAVAGLELSVTD
jgi:aminoglycoside phosphotransferase (APT) family kinase protein